MPTPTAQVIPKQSEKGLYSLMAELSGHTGLVLCMSVTEDGKLASGGIDGVRVWDLRKSIRQQDSSQTSGSKWALKQLQRPSGAGHRGAATVLSWIRREDAPDDGLIFGTAEGFVVCWMEKNIRETSYEETYCAQLARPGEITAIAFEAGSNRLAVSNRNSVIQLFQVGPNLDLHPLFSVVIENHVPKAIAFAQSGNDKDIYSFGLYDGRIHTISATDGKMQETRDTGSKIGNVAINFRRGVFCIDDPAEGVALYRSDSWDRVRTYPVGIERSMRPRQVSFVEDCKFIISGSDHGAVYVFDRRSGNMVDKLMTGKNRIQAITTMERPKMPLIFSAMSRGDDAPCTILIWRKNLENPKVEETKPPKAPWTDLRTLLQGCMLLMAAAFIWQNIPSSPSISTWKSGKPPY